MVCTYQQDALAPEQVRHLEAALRKTYAERFSGAATPTVLWCELPAGQAFTEARPSDISYVMVEVEDGLDAPRREAAMMALAETWARVAGVPIEMPRWHICGIRADAMASSPCAPISEPRHAALQSCLPRPARPVHPPVSGPRHH
jgi:hypothetical protein